MIILNNGCSFSAKTWPVASPIVGNAHVSYCDFLPGEIHNIAQRGSGIEVTRVMEKISSKFLGDAELTHFIYQVPHPTRQPMFEELRNDEEFYKTTLQIDEIWGIKDAPPYGIADLLNIKNIKGNPTNSARKKWSLTVLLKRLGNRFKQYATSPNPGWQEQGNVGWEESTKTEYLQQNFLWHQLRHEHKIFGRDVMDRYLKKALNGVNENVNIVRSKWPNVKIIILRYEETKIPLIYEYGKDWFKNTLSNYCKDNNITYIYEENFNTKWFKSNGLCDDKRHPNKAGAKLIADKIKEYL